MHVIALISPAIDSILNISPSFHNLKTLAIAVMEVNLYVYDLSKVFLPLFAPFLWKEND